MLINTSKMVIPTAARALYLNGLLLKNSFRVMGKIQDSVNEHKNRLNIESSDALIPVSFDKQKPIWGNNGFR
jgi:hypothetical protein